MSKPDICGIVDERKQPHPCAEKIRHRTWVVDDHALGLIFDDTVDYAARATETPDGGQGIAIDIIKSVRVDRKTVNQLQHRSQRTVADVGATRRHQISKKISVIFRKRIRMFVHILDEGSK